MSRVRSSLRAWLKTATRSWVVKKRLPEDLGGGPAYCSPNAMLSVLKPGWPANSQARGLFDWVRRYVQPSMVVWDIGANQGLFSIASAARCGASGRVCAFEPDIEMAALLSRSVRHQPPGVAPIDVIPCAIADRCGFAELEIAAGDRALNHLAEVRGNPRFGSALRKSRVLVFDGDSLAERLGLPDLIKIDVEGAEALVVKGLEGTLARAKPSLIIEVAPENKADIGRALRRHGYEMFDACSTNQAALAKPAWNTFACARP